MGKNTNNEIFEKKKILCDSCGKRFKNFLSLEKHKNKPAPCFIKREGKCFKCDFCLKTFTRHQNLKYHLEKSCKNKINNINNNNAINNSEILELKKELEEIKKQLKESQQEKQNNNLIPSNNNTNTLANNSNNNMASCSNNNMTNSTIATSSYNTDNSINNTQQNVYFSNYTGNGMPPLSIEEIEPILKRGFQIPIELTRAIHFNPKYPEYHNIFLPKADEKRAMVYRDGMWKSINRDDIIDDIYEHKRAYVVENLDKYKKKLNASKQKSLQRWLDAEESDQSVINTKKDLQYLLYDNRHVVIERKKNYEKSKVKI
jgi:hypothetical protein